MIENNNFNILQIMHETNLYKLLIFGLLRFKGKLFYCFTIKLVEKIVSNTFQLIIVHVKTNCLPNHTYNLYYTTSFNLPIKSCFTQSQTRSVTLLSVEHALAS